MTEDHEAESAEPGDPGADADSGHRCGFVALIGAPNAGKSTLVNQAVGVKVSIVTHKVQTTRSIIRGVVMRGQSQIVFVDTPGIFAPKRRLDRAMVDRAWSGARDADLFCILLDAKKGIDPESEEILRRAAGLPHDKILLLNKIDTVARESLLALAAEANEIVAFSETFMISALNGSGVDDLLEHLAKAVQPGPWLYPEDQISDLPMRNLASEVTREKLYLRLHDELPYRSTVETTQWKDLKDGSARIEQTIFVERDSQKKIVIGKNGQAIKAVSSTARAEIAEMIDRPVHLFLFVKVRDAWADDPERYREMGLDFPSN